VAPLGVDRFLRRQPATLLEQEEFRRFIATIDVALRVGVVSYFHTTRGLSCYAELPHSTVLHHSLLYWADRSQRALCSVGMYRLSKHELVPL
jgi:ribosomal protein L1